jgi:hypothetical protein
LGVAARPRGASAYRQVALGFVVGILALISSNSVLIGLIVVVAAGLTYGIVMARRMSKCWPGAKDISGADRRHHLSPAGEAVVGAVGQWRAVRSGMIFEKVIPHAIPFFGTVAWSPTLARGRDASTASELPAVGLCRHVVEPVSDPLHATFAVDEVCQPVVDRELVEERRLFAAAAAACGPSSANAGGQASCTPRVPPTPTPTDPRRGP